MSEWKFKRDTSFRKQFFVPDSFAHPAKMDAQLLIKIVEEYTKPGETILDPMAGSGTTMLACTLGRNCILVELEEKFCKMMVDNWEEVRMRPQLGYAMGGCQILQGDARQLGELLVDKIVTSPPFLKGSTGEGLVGRDLTRKCQQDYLKKGLTSYGTDNPHNIANLPYGELDKCIFSPPYAEAQSGGGIAQEGYTKPFQKDKIGGGNLDPVGKRSYMPENIGGDPGQISRLPYGQIDKIVTSPPYEEAMGKKPHSPRADKLAQEKSNPVTYTDRVDNIITSPPYEGTTGEGKEIGSEGHAVGAFHYGNNSQQIGNLKSDSYLEAMLQVYQQCHQVLKPSGLMILVTKNFIRNKQVVRLDTDTFKLCEQVGFNYQERHCRRLPAQSFWRVIYHQKHPEVEQIEYEDILVFNKLT